GCLRQLWSMLEPGLTRKGRSSDHEATWLNLAGYTMRPGYGHYDDSDFMEAMWRTYTLGLNYVKEPRVLDQWWIMWRRVAGGLSAQRQDILFAKIFPLLKKDRAQSPEQYLLAGSLERVDMNKKVQLGNALAEQIARGGKNHIDGKIWCLARLSSRVPLYSGLENIVRPKFVEEWAETLASLNIKQKQYMKLSFFYSQGGRIVGDREFDLSADARMKFLDKLATQSRDSDQYKVVADFHPVSAKDKNQLFGEELPVGLSL
ncbi:MAG: hypothetical protein CMP10_03885, partial [Zetaproteobacteria bacterium]|nr:hypothetical protein [Pseudobdellovibrionaceae bacterium]